MRMFFFDESKEQELNLISKYILSSIYVATYILYKIQKLIIIDCYTLYILHYIYP
jgi:hypothetical protein